MGALTDVQVITRDTLTRFEPVILSPERIGETVGHSKQEWEGHTRENTFIPTSTAANITSIDITSPSWSAEKKEGPTSGWNVIDWASINPQSVIVSTPADTSTATTIGSLRSLLRMQLRDDRLRRMSPERRAMYERIRKLRDEIGPIDFDVVEALRELRENA